MPTAATQTYGEGRLFPLYNAEDAIPVNVPLDVNLTLAAGTVLGRKTGTNAVQTLSIAGTPTGGTFKVTFRGVTSAAIAYNAAASAVQTALRAMSTIGAAGVACSGGALPGTAVVLTFAANLGEQPVELVTTTDAFTGGTNPASSVANTTPGLVGVYTSYASGNSDGSQVATGLLEYASVTDASGNITSVGEWGQTSKGAPMFISGIFRCQDTVGLDAAGIANMGGFISAGTVTSGTFQIG